MPAPTTRCREEHQVVDQDAVEAQPQQRRGDYPSNSIASEYASVRNAGRRCSRRTDLSIVRQRMRHPRQTPDAEERIVMARHARAQVQRTGRYDEVSTVSSATAVSSGRRSWGSEERPHV